MPISEGLRSTLNKIRETSIENGTLYAKQIDEITPDMDISMLSSKLFNDVNLMNEFMSVLARRIVYTQVVNYKLFNNPLKFLEGDAMPLGAIGQEIHINPAKGRKFNVNDFAGLLAKYEADVKVQYMHLNSDIQYPVTITRSKLKDAFVSWGELESFVNSISQSLYNGAYINRYNFTKGLVASAYNSGNVIIDVIDNPKSTKEKAEDFLVKARTYFLNMQEPTSDYNAWKKVGGYGNDVITWTDPKDIVLLIRNDIGAFLDVKVLAEAFNVDKASLLGRVKYVKDFNEYDSEGNLVVDGSKIYGMIADRRWFRIKNQETTMDEFYNANNKTWQMYLDDANMYQYSLFCNAICFASEEPTITITGMNYNQTTPVVIEGIGESEGLEVTTTPLQANSPTIVYSIIDNVTEDEGEVVATVEASSTDPKVAIVTSVAAGTCKLKATAGNVSTTVDITVNA